MPVRPVKFIFVSAVPNEDGGDILYGVDKVGHIWRGVLKDGHVPEWEEIERPEIPDRPEDERGPGNHRSFRS